MNGKRSIFRSHERVIGAPRSLPVVYASPCVRAGELEIVRLIKRHLEGLINSFISGWWHACQHVCGRRKELFAACQSVSRASSAGGSTGKTRRRDNIYTIYVFFLSFLPPPRVNNSVKRSSAMRRCERLVRGEDLILRNSCASRERKVASPSN